MKPSLSVCRYFMWKDGHRNRLSELRLPRGIHKKMEIAMSMIRALGCSFANNLRSSLIMKHFIAMLSTLRFVGFPPRLVA